MKNKVKFSVISLVTTAIVIALPIVGIISLRHDADRAVILALIFGVAIVFGLYYCPVSVEADQSGIKLHRLLAKPREFAYGDIQSVETCIPSIGGVRLCGSGGCFGYWGYFSDFNIGTYFGYYGSRNHCFLVKLKNGRNYVLGCDDPAAMINYISPRLSK